MLVYIFIYSYIAYPYGVKCSFTGHTSEPLPLSPASYHNLVFQQVMSPARFTQIQIITPLHTDYRQKCQTSTDQELTLLSYPRHRHHHHTYHQCPNISDCNHLQLHDQRLQTNPSQDNLELQLTGRTIIKTDLPKW